MSKKKYSLVLLISALFVLAMAVISLSVGSYGLSPGEILEIIGGGGTKAGRFAFYNIRLPRTVLALLVGSALAVSGGVLQSVTRNQLAEPGLIGINAGAALFVVIWINHRTEFYYSGISLDTAKLMPVLAMSGGLLAVTFIYLFAYKNGVSPGRFILTGIGVNAAINALISYYRMAMSTGDYNEVLTWTNGSLWGSNWDYISFTAPLIIVIAAIILAKSRTLDVITLGDDLALGLGVNVGRQTLLFLILASLLASAATAVAGNIAFLGLLGPQIAKRLTGPDHGKMLPCSALIGSGILIGADTVARNMFSPIEIPVGIIVSVLGVPYFMYLMMKSD